MQEQPHRNNDDPANEYSVERMNPRRFSLIAPVRHYPILAGSLHQHNRRIRCGRTVNLLTGWTRTGYGWSESASDCFRRFPFISNHNRYGLLH
jgi:hypothetical protein